MAERPVPPGSGIPSGEPDTDTVEGPREGALSSPVNLYTNWTAPQTLGQMFLKLFHTWAGGMNRSVGGRCVVESFVLSVEGLKYDWRLCNTKHFTSPWLLEVG